MNNNDKIVGNNIDKKGQKQQQKIIRLDTQKISFRNTINKLYQSCAYLASHDDQKHSSASSFSNSNFSQKKTNFFKQLIEQKKVIKIKIENIILIPKQSYHRAYTLYQIQILTEELFYQTQKRYSQFQSFYKNIKKLKKVQELELNFPKKTYWSTGNQIGIINSRIRMLNQFIDSILYKINPSIYPQSSFLDVKYMLFDFFGIYEKYNEKGFDIFNKDFQCIPYNNEMIQVEIFKLNVNQTPKNISIILQKLQKIVFQYKIKPSPELAKNILFGFQDKKGLIQYSLNLKNDYVAVNCLEVILKFINPQFNRASDIYLKALQSSSVKKIIVQQQSKILFENLNFKRLYFQLIRNYQTKPIEKDLKSIFCFKVNRQQKDDNQDKQHKFNPRISLEMHNEKQESRLDLDLLKQYKIWNKEKEKQTQSKFKLQKQQQVASSYVLQNKFDQKTLIETSKNLTDWILTENSSQKQQTNSFQVIINLTENINMDEKQKKIKEVFNFKKYFIKTNINSNTKKMFNITIYESETFIGFKLKIRRSNMVKICDTYKLKNRKQNKNISQNMTKVGNKNLESTSKKYHQQFSSKQKEQNLNTNTNMTQKQSEQEVDLDIFFYFLFNSVNKDPYSEVITKTLKKPPQSQSKINKIEKVNKQVQRQFQKEFSNKKQNLLRFKFKQINQLNYDQDKNSHSNRVMNNRFQNLQRSVLFLPLHNDYFDNCFIEIQKVNLVMKENNAEQSEKKQINTKIEENQNQDYYQILHTFLFCHKTSDKKQDIKAFMISSWTLILSFCSEDKNN